MRTPAVLFLFIVTLAFVLLVGCGEEKEKINRLQAEIDSLKSIISKLQETDSYYYQKGVSNRQNRKYEESNAYFKEMIERFPNSHLITEARPLIRKNNNDIVQSLYDKAVSSQKTGEYQRSNELADELIAKFPKSSLAYKAKKLKASNRKRISEKEEAESRRAKQEEEAERRRDEFEAKYLWGHISAEELCRDYNRNEVDADLLYKNTFFVVHGTVDDIGKDILDQIYVTLKGHGITKVQCFFSNAYTREIAQLRKGQPIKIRGKCKGKSIYYVLFEECSLR